MKEKYVRAQGNEAVLGWRYADGSQQPLLRLYNDERGTFQLAFMEGTDTAYSFLPECKPLLDILKGGIVGVPIKDIAQRLAAEGFVSGGQEAR